MLSQHNNVCATLPAVIKAIQKQLLNLWSTPDRDMVRGDYICDHSLFKYLLQKPTS